MTADREELLIGALFAPAGDLEPTDVEVARTVATRNRAVPRAPQTWARVPALRPRIAGLAAVALIGAGGYSVPVTRAAMQDTFSNFSDYFSGHDTPTAPGRPLRPTDAPPPWLRSSSTTGQRVLAEYDGVALYMVREPGGAIAFQLDRNVGFSDTPQGWAQRLRDHPIAVLGPGGGDASGRTTDLKGRRPVFGLTAGSVRYVELRYSDGTATSSGRVSGGFVLLADPSRRPQTLLALDASGHVMDTIAARLW